MNSILGNMKAPLNLSFQFKLSNLNVSGVVWSLLNHSFDVFPQELIVPSISVVSSAKLSLLFSNCHSSGVQAYMYFNITNK